MSVPPEGQQEATFRSDGVGPPGGSQIIQPGVQAAGFEYFQPTGPAKSLVQAEGTSHLGERAVSDSVGVVGRVGGQDVEGEHAVLPHGLR